MDWLKKQSDRRILAGIGILKALWLVLFFTLFKNTAWAGHIYVDVWSWLEFLKNSREGLIPYVEFSKEYPHLAGYFYWLLSPLFDRSSEQILYLHSTIMWTLDLLNTYLFLKIIRFLKLPYLFWGLVLFQFNLTALILSPFRYESLLLVFILSGYLYHLRGRFLISSLFWSIGFHIKWITIFFLLSRDAELFFLRGKKIRAIQSLTIFGLIAVIVFVPLAVLNLSSQGNLKFMLDPFHFHIHRPLYWDTLLGVMELWWGENSWESWAPTWSLGLILISTFALLKFKLEARIILIGISVLIFNRVYSPQFHLWFYPFLVLLILRSQRLKQIRYWIVWASLDITSTLIYPFSFTYSLRELIVFVPYQALDRGGLWTKLFSALIVARALILGVLAFHLMRDQRREEA